ncbi:MAG: hypothetical protein DWP94_04625 [Flavobacterium sp.]|nr:MAG: hypothetical protein DWP94_04625 [Flavobacterium sp.]
MAQNNQEEVDLFVVLKRLNKVYQGFLASVYKGIRFVIKNWIVLTILIVGGYFIGGWWQRSLTPTKEAVMIVQNNFDSSNYVYNAIDLLNVKYKQGHKSFVKQYGFDTENPDISEIVVEPIVNIVELLEKQETNDRNLESYLSRVTFEEDPLLSEIYFPEYTFHKITISTEKSDPAIIDKVLNYLNNNEIYNKTKDVVVSETQLRIQRNDVSIANIDAIFDEYSGKNADGSKPSEMNFLIQENNNLHQLLDKKKELIEENEFLKKELIKYDSVVSLLNSPNFYNSSDFFSKKRTLLPIALVLLYIGFFVIRNIYLKGKKYSEEISEA